MGGPQDDVALEWGLWRAATGGRGRALLGRGGDRTPCRRASRLPPAAGCTRSTARPRAGRCPVRICEVGVGLRAVLGAGDRQRNEVVPVFVPARSRDCAFSRRNAL